MVLPLGERQNIGQLISKILKENELVTEAVVKNYFTTASDGKRYNVVFYSLAMIIAVGYRVRGVRGTQFRQWATQHLSEYLVNQTAAEIVSVRANANKPNMGLTSWQGSIVRRSDIAIARNYLSENEIDTLNRIVTLFIEDAELRVKGRKDLSLDYWKDNVDRLLRFQDRQVLQGNGTITAQESERIAKEQYDLFDAKRKRLEAEKADADDIKLLEDIEKQFKQQQ